jgi:hypothetical protein
VKSTNFTVVNDSRSVDCTTTGICSTTTTTATKSVQLAQFISAARFGRSATVTADFGAVATYADDCQVQPIAFSATSAIRKHGPNKSAVDTNSSHWDYHTKYEHWRARARGDCRANA